MSKFIDSHRDQLTLPPPTNLSPFLWPLIYLNLDSLLSLLQNNPVLAIIDFFSDVIEKIENLRDYGFGGSWFDSLESLIADNVQYDDEHLKKLKDKERELKGAKDFACQQLNMIRTKQQKIDDLTSEHAEILRYRVKWFKRQRKLVEPELANLMEKMKAVYGARNSFNFFYPS